MYSNTSKPDAIRILAALQWQGNANCACLAQSKSLFAAFDSLFCRHAYKLAYGLLGDLYSAGQYGNEHVKGNYSLCLQMQAALGATSVEGSFRTGCEHIMRVARQYSSTFNALLQSILLDPLVSWASDRQQASTKKVFSQFMPSACHCMTLSLNYKSMTAFCRSQSTYGRSLPCFFTSSEHTLAENNLEVQK